MALELICGPQSSEPEVEAESEVIGLELICEPQGASEPEAVEASLSTSEPVESEAVEALLSTSDPVETEPIDAEPYEGSSASPPTEALEASLSTAEPVEAELSTDGSELLPLVESEGAEAEAESTGTGRALLPQGVSLELLPAGVDDEPEVG